MTQFRERVLKIMRKFLYFFTPFLYEKNIRMNKIERFFINFCICEMFFEIFEVKNRAYYAFKSYSSFYKALIIVILSFLFL
jgi:hypothetical protein